jgi:hypothetical protein
MADRPQHPSKRPIHREQKRGRGYWNMPNNGPVTPRLQQPAPKDAIGFHVRSAGEPDLTDGEPHIWVGGRGWIK